MKYLITIVFSFISISLAIGQGANLNSPGGVRFGNYPETAMIQKMQYADVNGNCFWKKEWLPARVYMKTGEAYAIQKAKLNFYTNQIHFIDANGVEQAAQNKVKAIVFLAPGDTTRIASFKLIPNSVTEGVETFSQILAGGKIKLLKSTAIKLVKRDTDPLQGRPEWFFESREIYMIEKDGDTRVLKSLTKKGLFNVLNIESKDEAWLNEHHNKLKSEQDFIDFIAYRNSSKAS